MEMTRIELVSEDLSIGTSTIIVGFLGFPSFNLSQQSLKIGSFINFLFLQSFRKRVSRKVGANPLTASG